MNTDPPPTIFFFYLGLFCQQISMIYFWKNSLYNNSEEWDTLNVKWFQFYFISLSAILTTKIPSFMAQMLSYISEMFTSATFINKTFLVYSRLYHHSYTIALLIILRFSLVNMFLSCFFDVACVLPVVLFN